MKHTTERSLAAIAQAWEGASTNDEAAERLLEQMNRDPKLYREIVAPFEGEAARLAIQRSKRAERRVIWNRPSAPDKRVHALAQTNALTLLDMRLPSGKRLGDADADETREAAEHYRQAEAHMRSKAVFLEAVSAKVKGRKCVAECLSAEELERLRDAG